MSIRNLVSQKDHDNIISRLFHELREKGYQNVLACHGDLTDEQKPEKIYSESAEVFFCPDIYAEKEGVAYFFEVETDDSIDLSFTRVELETFARQARQCGGYFYLIVPAGIRDKAKALLNGIADKDWRRTFILTA